MHLLILDKVNTVKLCLKGKLNMSHEKKFRQKLHQVKNKVLLLDKDN